MKIIRPSAISGSQVTSSAAEAYPVWSSATTYAAAARVVRGDSVYESAQASNLNKDPLTQPTWWLRTGPSNKMALFDGQTSQASTATTSLSVALQMDQKIDAVALVGLQGQFARVTVRAGGPDAPVLYSSQQPLAGGESQDWYQYFFYDPFIRRTQALFLDLGVLFNTPHITLEVLGATGATVAIGEAIVGRLYEIGHTQYSPQSSIIDYSRKETDEFGTTTFVKRAYSKRLTARVMLENTQLNRVHRTLSDLRATPIMWIASDLPQFEEPLTVFGFYRDFSTEIAYPTASLVSIEIEGLI